MQIFTDVLLVVTIAAGTFCQRIEFANGVTDSPCTSYARSGKDKFKIDINIIGDIRRTLADGYNDIFTVLIIRYGIGVPNYLCTLNMTTTPCTDVHRKYCSCYPEQGRTRIAAMIPLETQYSKGVITAYWAHRRNLLPRLVSTNYTYPEVYDPGAASLTATINGGAGGAQSRLCSFDMTLYRSQILKVCCHSDLMPCYVKIEINGQEIARDVSPCYSYSSNTDITGVVTVSYSVCVNTEYDSSNKCSLPDVITTTTTTSTTTTVTSPTITTDELTTGINGPTGTDGDEMTTDDTALTTGLPKEATTSSLGILFWIFVAIAVLAVILATLAYCMLTRKRRTVANSRTPPARPPTPPAQRTPPPAAAARTTQRTVTVEERTSIESASISEAGTDV